MAAAAVGQIYVSTILGSLCGQRTMTQFTWQVKEVPGAQTVQDVYTQLRAALFAAGGLVPKMLPCLPDNWTMFQSWQQCVWPVRYVKKVTAESATGSSGIESSVPNVQAAVIRECELAGRPFVSTLKIPISPLDAGVNDGFIGGALDVALQAFALQNISTIGTTGTSPVLWPVIYHGPTVTPTPTNATRIVSAFAQQTTRVIRRRTVGLGI